MVDADEFVVAMTLMTADSAETLDERLQAAFYMFDADKSGDLTVDEVRRPIRKGVNTPGPDAAMSLLARAPLPSPRATAPALAGPPLSALTILPCFQRAFSRQPRSMVLCVSGPSRRSSIRWSRRRSSST